MFCCQGYRNLVNNAGQRGMGALIHLSSDGFKFYLESQESYNR
jgi:hypothetical protein